MKSAIAGFERPALIALLHDLYSASRENQDFLHTRFGLGEHALEPYKRTIQRWISPNVYRNEDFSVARAKKALADYRKAAGAPAGLAELQVYYCELASRFASEFGDMGEAYRNSLLTTFADALKLVMTMEDEPRRKFLQRLDLVCAFGERCGYGVGETMDELLDECGAWDDLDEDAELEPATD